MSRSLAETVIRSIAYPLLGLAIAAFVACVVLHLLVLVGGPLPSVDLSRWLVMGTIVVFFPSVLIGGQVSRGQRQPSGRAMLRGCPKWMLYGVFGLSAYVVLYGFLSSNREADLYPIGMAFYSFSGAVFYSAIHVEHIGPRRCPQGHEVSSSASYCDVCGQRLPPAPIE